MMEISLRVICNKSTKQEKPKLLVVRCISIILSAYFLLVSLDVLKSPVSVVELLRFTDLNYLADYQQGKAPFILYIFAILTPFAYLSVGFFIVIFVVITVYTLLLKRSTPKIVMITMDGVTRSWEFLGKYFIDPLYRSWMRILLILVISAWLWIIFYFFNLWKCTDVNCPSVERIMALILATFIFVWGFVPAKLLDKR